jgi:uncharacterized iron-regulated protein
VKALRSRQLLCLYFEDTTLTRFCRPSILNFQLQLLDVLSSQHPDEIVLVCEYFNLTQAQMLTDFSNQKLGVTELASAYAKSDENFDIDGHLAPLLLLAKDKRVPIIAGFPPREWARDFLEDGEGVLSKLKNEFAFDRAEDTKPKDLEYEAYFESLLSDSAPRETVPDGEARKGTRILPAQLLKDAVMAWSIDQQLAKGKIVLALAGIGHMEFGFGIPERVRQAKREDMILIACKSKNESELWYHERSTGAEGAGNLASDKTATAHDRTIADAVYLYDAV